MKKKKICFMPYDSLETYSIEQWLDEQALKGWYLERFKGGFAVFHKSAPGQIRYRIDILSPEKYDMEQEMHEDAAAQGWHYVCDFSWSSYSVYCTDDPEAPELHSDPFVLRSAMKGRVTATLAALMILLVYLVFQCVQPDGLPAIVRNSSGSLIYTDSIVYQLVALILLLIFWLLFAYISADSILRAYRDLAAGHVVSRRKPWVRRTLYTALTLLGLAAFILVFGFSRDGYRNLVALESWSEPFPVQTWEEFAPEEYRAFHDDDFVFENKSPFAKRIIMLRQKSFQPENDFYYDVDICQMKSSSIAEKLFDAFVQEYGAELVPESSDRAYVQNDSFQAFILRSEKTVVRICYHGTEDLTAVKTDL